MQINSTDVTIHPCCEEEKLILNAFEMPCQKKVILKSPVLFVDTEIRDPSRKSHNVSDKGPTIHHSVSEICAHMRISVTNGALWDIWLVHHEICGMCVLWMQYAFLLCTIIWNELAIGDCVLAKISKFDYANQAHQVWRRYLYSFFSYDEKCYFSFIKEYRETIWGLPVTSTMTSSPWKFFLT